jgi:hypothetical protein
MFGTALIAFLAAVATAHTTTGQTGASANYLLRTDLGMNSHPLINPKSQLTRLISQNAESNDAPIPSDSPRSAAPNQSRPEVWAGSFTVTAQTVF